MCIYNSKDNYGIWQHTIYHSHAFNSIMRENSTSFNDIMRNLKKMCPMSSKVRRVCVNVSQYYRDGGKTAHEIKFILDICSGGIGSGPII